MLDVFKLIFHPTSNFEYFFERQNTHIECLFRFLISKSSVYSFNKTMDSSDSDSTGSKQKSPVKGRAFKKHLKNKSQDGNRNTDEEPQKEVTKAKKDKAPSKGAKDWLDDEVSLLIEMLEERPCLWDVFNKDYSKRDAKDVAYNEIADVLQCNVNSIKTKINGLRAQLGREMAKVNKTKSGQSTDELYVSNWTHYKSLAFLQSVMKASNSKNTLKQPNEDLDTEYTDVPEISRKKSKTIAERKIELLTKCTDAITSSSKESQSQGVKRTAFATYIDEKLSTYNKRQRAIAEKRINDVLFEIEMSDGNYQSFPNSQPAPQNVSSATFQLPTFQFQNRNPYQPMEQGNESYLEYLNNSK